MLSGFSSVALALLLPFFIEGVRSATTDLEFTATANPAPLPTLSPTLFLADLGSPLSTCTNQNIAWSYNGPGALLVIEVTNFGVPQGPPPTPGHNFTDNGSVAKKVHRRDSSTITNLIAEDVDASVLHTIWKVNVPSGWYRVVVNSGDQRLDQTDQFYIQNGPDTSCLIGVPAEPSSSSSSPSPTTSHSPQETVSPPAPVSSATKDNHVGIIIGVVAGAVVALILILIAFLCVRRRKHAQERPSIGYPAPTGGLRRGWGGLTSVTSIHSVKGDRTSRDLTAFAREPAHNKEGTSGSGSSTPFTLEEKAPASPEFSSRNPFDDAEGGITLATLPSNARRASLGSSVQRTPPLRNPSIDAIVSSYDVDGSLPSTDLSSSRHNSLTATEMIPSSSTSSSSVSPIERNKVERDSGGSQSAVRKTPRKPVPAYDPSLDTSTSPCLENSSPLVRTPSTPIAVSSFSGQGHYAKKAHLNASTPEGIDMLPRKSSFGPGGIEGKAIHYLIPDMPLPKSN